MNADTRKVMFSDESVEWYTPLWLYRLYDERFHFTTDPCAEPTNRLGCRVFYTKEDDGLRRQWYGNVFCNPPYGKNGHIERWVARCVTYATGGHGVVVVMLLPVRSDTDWYQKYIWDKNSPQPRDKFREWVQEVHFIDKRVKFVPPPECILTKRNSSAFPSMIVVLGRNNNNNKIFF